jgi:DNA-binding IclR family transcriptional regulator
MEDTFIMQNITSPAPAVVRALGILKTLGEAKEPQGVSALSRALGIGKSSVHAIARALLVSGAIEDAGGRKYRLGPLVEELARRKRDGRSLAEMCQPCLAELAGQVGQTCIFGTVEKERFRIVCAVEGWGAFQVKAVAGGSIPLLAGASGKVVLAWGGVPIPETLPRFTEDSAVDVTALGEELKRVRREALALDRGEYLQGVYAAAAPVLDRDRLLGVILSAGFRDRLGEDGLIALGQAVSQVAQDVSREFSEWRVEQ